MNENFPTTPLKDVLYLSNDQVSVDSVSSYPIAGVYSFGQGLFERQSLTGLETTYKTFHRLHQNDFVLSQLKGWEGALARVSKRFDGWFLSPQFQTFRAVSEKLDISYLEWYCKQAKVWEELKNKSRGMGARRDTVSPNQLLSLTIPLPPLKEQHRVITRIEELVAKIEEVRGVRRELFEETDNLMEAFISQKFSVQEDSGWNDGQLGDYIIDDCYGTSEKTIDDPDGIPILRMGNIQNGSIDIRDLKYLYLENRAKDKQILKKGDIVVNRTNSAELVGKCAVFDLEGEYGFASYLIRLRIDQTRADPWLLALYINSSLGREYMFRERTQMTGQANVNAPKIKALPIRLPSLSEQQQIVKHINLLQSKIDTVKQKQADTSRELDALLPSILDKAFKGEL